MDTNYPNAINDFCYARHPVEHDGPIPVERIAFEDGVTWDILTEMPYGVQSRIRSAASTRIKLVDGQVSSEAVDASGMVETLEEAKMIRLVGCSVAWSWDMPISRESIEMLSPRHVNVILELMNELHAVDMLGVSKEEKKRSSKPSTSTNHFGEDGSTQDSTSAPSNSASPAPSDITS